MKTILSIFCVALLLLGGVLAWRYSSSNSQEEAVILTEDSASHANNKSIGAKISLDASPYSNLSDPAIPHQKRVAVLRDINPDKLSDTDIDALFQLLNHQPESGEESAWYLVMNEVMEQLRIHQIDSVRFIDSLLGIAQSPESLDVTRDYAIQHLALFINPLATEGTAHNAPSLQAQQNILSSFTDFIQHPELAQTSIPGTTLMAIADLHDSGISDELLNPVLEELTPWLTDTISGKSEANIMTTTSAINAVSILQLSEFTPVIRNLLASDKTPPSIRLNSIAALGVLGDDSDKSTLLAIADSKSKFRFAAKSALKNLNKEHTN